MKKQFLVFIGSAFIAIVISIGMYALLSLPQSEQKEPIDIGGAPALPISIMSSTFNIEGTQVELVNGKAEQSITRDSASKDIYLIFGEPTVGDLDGDGDEDEVAFLTRTTGGSGTFYYVVVAVNDGGLYKGTNAMFLGDRIAPQNINIIDGVAVANFVERATGEPFTVAPSVGKSVWIHLDPFVYEIGELVKNFEGEAEPAHMSLNMKKWNWIRTVYDEGSVVEPKTLEVFMLMLRDDATFSAVTDCNSVGGSYTVDGTKIIFKEMMSTLMFCEQSQESIFTEMLSRVYRYSFTSKGELYLELANPAGKIIFR